MLYRFRIIFQFNINLSKMNLMLRKNTRVALILRIKEFSSIFQNLS